MKRTSRQGKRHTPEARALAAAMYYNGATSTEVAKEFGMSASYVRGLLFRTKPPTAADEPAPVSPVSNAPEIAAKIQETPVSRVGEKRALFTELDAVIWTTTLTTVAAVVTAFGWWGLPLSIVYALVLFHAMRMAADPTVQKTAENGAGIVILFEMLAACAHTYIFNLVLWSNRTSLPFEVHQEIQGGELVWVNGHLPFVVAATVGAVLSGSAVYALVTKIKITRERSRAR